MEIAPLIRSRTRYTEFNDREKFLVRPADLDLQWAMNKISPAMINVDTLEGVRRVVASNGDFCIAGVVCGLQYFVRNYLSSDEAENFRDERDRAVKIFLGYVFKGEGVPDVSDSKLWQMFKDTLAPLWERKTIDPVIASYENCGVKNISKKSFDQKIYPSGKETDVELFEQCLAARKNFCSNVDDVKIFDSGEYEIITASPSVINRLQKKNQSPPVTTPRQKQAMTPTPIRTRRMQNSKQSKTNWTLVTLGSAIAAVVAIVYFLISWLKS